MAMSPSSGTQETAGEKKSSSTPLTPLKFTLMFSLPFTLVFILLLAALMVWEKSSRERDLMIEMRESARAYFEQILITRLWNADHGGVYVEVTEKVQPNPYLKDDPGRDIITRDGRTYTKINPAFMTRQLSELAFSQGRFKFRITSLRPINPQNSPDAWETTQLKRFEEKHKHEAYEVFSDSGSRKFRYMAPLTVDEACLKCHWKQGYAVGDVRGGISIDIPMDVQMESFLAMSRRIIASLSIIGITALCFIIGITWIFSKKIVQSINQEMERERLKTTVQLAGAAAHEIRQPLTVIVGFLELLKNKKEFLQEDIDLISDQCFRIDGIIKKMLNITKFQTKHYIEGTEIFDLHAQTGEPEEPSSKTKPD